MMQKEINNIKSYIKRNKKIILVLLMLAIATYSIKIFNYDLSIDSEVTTNDITANDIPWIATGRWALTFLGKFLHFGCRYNPFFSNFMMIVFYTISIVILGYVISIILKNKKLESVTLLVIGSMVMTSPVIAEMLNFTMMTAEVAIGLMLISFSVYSTYLAVYKKNKLCYLITIITLSFSMGIYQAFFPLYISLIAYIYLIKILEEKQILKKDIFDLIKIVLIFIISYIICSLITKFLLIHFELTASSYLTNQINWGKIPYIDVITIVKRAIKGIVFPNVYSPIWNYGYIFFCFASILYMIFLIKNRKKNSILPILCLIFIMFSPFLMILITGNVVAIRTMMNLPFVVALLSILIINKIHKTKVIKNVVYIVIFLIVIIQFKSTLDLFYSNYVRYEEDKSLVQSIFTKVDMLEELDKSREETTVVFVGMRSSKSTGVIAKGDSMSYSFFEWDPATELASNKRIFGLSRALGYVYKMPTVEEVKQAKEIQNELDVYPHKDSIVVKDGLVIIRIS